MKCFSASPSPVSFPGTKKFCFGPKPCAQSEDLAEQSRLITGPLSGMQMPRSTPQRAKAWVDKFSRRCWHSLQLEDQWHKEDTPASVSGAEDDALRRWWVVDTGLERVLYLQASPRLFKKRCGNQAALGPKPHPSGSYVHLCFAHGWDLINLDIKKLEFMAQVTYRVSFAYLLGKLEEFMWNFGFADTL